MASLAPSPTTTAHPCDVAPQIWLIHTSCAAKGDPIPTSCETLFAGPHPTCTESGYSSSGCPEHYTTACSGVYSSDVKVDGSTTYHTTYKSVYCCPDPGRWLNFGGSGASGIASAVFALDCSALADKIPLSVLSCILSANSSLGPSQVTVAKYTPDDTTPGTHVTGVFTPDYPNGLDLTIKANPTRHDFIELTVKYPAKNPREMDPSEHAEITTTNCLDAGCPTPAQVTAQKVMGRATTSEYTQKVPLIGGGLGTIGMAAPIVFAVVLILCSICILRPFVTVDYNP